MQVVLEPVIIFYNLMYSRAIELALPFLNDMSRAMRKPDFCPSENKGADQLHSNCEADQRLCFRYMDSTIPLLIKPKFQASSLLPRLYRPVCVRPGWKPRRLVFSRLGSFFIRYYTGVLLTLIETPTLQI